MIFALWSPLTTQAQPPRVLGTAQSDQEFDAYRAVLAASNPQAVADAAGKFLAQYPTSGLAAYVHQSAVQAYYKLGEMPQVIRHGEAALQDLPDNAVLLGLVSAAYLDQHQPEKAVDRAKQTLAALGKLQPPANGDSTAWRAQVNALDANVRLTLGSALLEIALHARTGEESSSLKDAVVNLQDVLAKTPRSEQASYRLATAFSALGDSNHAIHYYAWTAALEGRAAIEARTKLTELCRAENQSPDAAIAAARAEIERLAAAR